MVSIKIFATMVLLSSFCLVKVMSYSTCLPDYDVKQCVEGFLDEHSYGQCGNRGYALRCNQTGLHRVPEQYPAPRSDYTPPPCLLDLSNNQLTELHNDTFLGTSCMNATNLLWLYLQHNMISNIDSGAFNGLSNLIYLNLTDNRLKWQESFGLGVFEPLISLENLNIKNNTFDDFTDLDHALMPMRKSLLGLYLNPTKPGLVFSEGFRNLTKLSVLSLSGMRYNVCNMDVVVNETFKNVNQIRHLFMNNCKVTRIEANAFSPLKNLWTLDISYNEDLHFKGMNRALYGLRGSDTLYELRVKQLHSLFECGIVFEEKYLENLKTLRNLTSLRMDLNKIEVFNETIFNPDFQFPATLTDFTLSGNRLTYGRYVHHLHKACYVRHVDISRQHLNYDPFFYHSSIPNGVPKDHYQDYQVSWSVTEGPMPTVMPSSTKKNRSSIPATILSNIYGRSPSSSGQQKGMLSTKLSPNSSYGTLNAISTHDSSHPRALRGDVDECSCGTPGVICLPPNLTKIQWTKSFLFIRIEKLFICKAEKLRVLDLSFNLITEWTGPVLGLEGLHHLNLSDNLCGQVSSEFFSSFHSLVTLNVSSNRIGSMLRKAQTNETDKLFSKLHYLKSLDLSYNKIERLSENLFRNLINLEHLLLRNNRLRDWTVVLTSRNLTKLDLTGNKLDDLPEFLLEYLDSQSQNRNVTLNLSFNKIECSCETIPFLKWTVQTRVKIQFDEHDSCRLNGRFERLKALEKRKTIVDRLETDICLERSWKSIVVGCVSSVVGCLITVFVGIGVYRNRWKLRHMYYSRHRRFLHEGYEHLFAHDAYISYSKERAGFIKDRLVPVLEGHHRLKLWVSDRDSQAGVSVAENIVHAIYNSRKTVLLVDSAYLQDTWCDYDMNMALVESVEAKRKLIVIVLMENFQMDALPVHVLRFLRSERSLEFPEYGGDIETFWTNLAIEIHS